MKRILVISSSFLPPLTLSRTLLESFNLKTYSLKSNLGPSLKLELPVLSLARPWLELTDLLLLWADVVVCLDASCLSFLRYFPTQLERLFVELADPPVDPLVFPVQGFSSQPLIFSMPYLEASLSVKLPVYCLSTPDARAVLNHDNLLRISSAPHAHRSRLLGQLSASVGQAVEALQGEVKVYPRSLFPSADEVSSEADAPFLLRAIFPTQEGTLRIHGRANDSGGSRVIAELPLALVSFYCALPRTLHISKLQSHLGTLGTVTELTPPLPGFYSLVESAGVSPVTHRFLRVSMPNYGINYQQFKQLERRLHFLGSGNQPDLWGLTVLSDRLSVPARFQLQHRLLFDSLMDSNNLKPMAESTLAPNSSPASSPRAALLLEADGRLSRRETGDPLLSASGFVLLTDEQATPLYLGDSAPPPSRLLTLVKEFRAEVLFFHGSEALALYLALCHREMRLPFIISDVRERGYCLENLIGEAEPSLTLTEAATLLLKKLGDDGQPRLLFELERIVGCTSYGEIWQSTTRRNEAAYLRAVLDATPSKHPILIQMNGRDGMQEARESHEGGRLYSTQKSGVRWENVVEFDVRSSYPTRIIHLGISPEGAKILPAFLVRLLQARELAKGQGDEIRQLAYKLMANTFYGWLSLVFPRLGALIVRNARELLEAAIKFIDEGGENLVVCGFTDSLFVRLCEHAKDGSELLSELNHQVGKRFGASFEKKKHFQVMVKAREHKLIYAGLTVSGEGEQGTWCELKASSFYFQVAGIPYIIKEHLLSYLGELLATSDDEELPLVIPPLPSNQPLWQFCSSVGYSNLAVLARLLDRDEFPGTSPQVILALLFCVWKMQLPMSSGRILYYTRSTDEGEAVVPLLACQRNCTPQHWVISDDTLVAHLEGSVLQLRPLFSLPPLDKKQLKFLVVDGLRPHKIHKSSKDGSQPSLKKEWSLRF